ncbi:MAG: histidine kinase [Crocinitomicaceae bacterium]
MKTTVIILLTLFPFIYFAQSNTSEDTNEQRIERLKNELNLKKPSANDLETILEIRRYFDRVNLDSALYYASIALDIADKIEDPGILASMKLSKSVLLRKLQRIDEAKQLLIENVNNKKLIPDTLIAQSYLTLARTEIHPETLAESFEHAVAASKIYIRLNDSLGTANSFAHIAGINLFAKDDPDQAIPYFRKALKYRVRSRDGDMVRLLINYSSAFVKVGKYDQAVGLIKRAEKIHREHNLPTFEGSIYAQYALIYNYSGDYKKSLDYCLKGDSLIQSKSNIDGSSQGKIIRYLALNYKELKEYDKALYYFKQLERFRALDPWTINTNLIEIYKETGDFEQAFLLQEELIAAKDSSDNLAKNEKLLEVVEKYESEKKQQEIVTLNAEKELQDNEIRTQRLALYGTIAFFVVLILIGAVWYRTRTKLRETTLKLASSELQQRFLRTQLNPHFFFHALTSIEGYIYKNDKMESARFLRSFSGLMRNILEFSDVDLVTLREDIDFIKKYMELQQLNHDFTFNYEVEVSPELSTEDIQIPPMLIQPAVENAILHGALKTENGLVSIQYVKVDDQIQITIKDNGNNAEGAKPSSNRLHRSMSLDITEMRIKNFQEVHGVPIAYHPYNPANDENSSVLFRMPLHLGSD